MEGDDPRKLFWFDLSKVVKTAHTDGYNGMLLGNFKSEFTYLREWMIHHGMVENIGKLHGYEAAP